MPKSVSAARVRHRLADWRSGNGHLARLDPSGQARTVRGHHAENPMHLLPARPPETAQVETASAEGAAMLAPHQQAGAAEQHSMPAVRQSHAPAQALAAQKRQSFGVKAHVLDLVAQQLIADAAQEWASGSPPQGN